MFFKNKTIDIYTPFGKSTEKVYKPSLYDNEKPHPFEEISYLQVQTDSQNKELLLRDCAEECY